MKRFDLQNYIFKMLYVSLLKFYSVKKTLLSDKNKILNNEQIDNGITLKSKPIMQKTLYFLKNEMDNNARICYKVL